jgi:hypothetical protein
MPAWNESNGVGEAPWIAGNPPALHPAASHAADRLKTRERTRHPVEKDRRSGAASRLPRSWSANNPKNWLFPG